MRILLCHNFYKLPGGEDQSYASEAALLRDRGHEVVSYTQHNDSIDQMSSLGVALRTVFNRQTYREVRALLQTHRPDVMHCTNTFPLISPSVYYAARAERVPVVQSLRNYRQHCLSAYFLHQGQVCERCLGKSLPLPGIVRGCYRNSRAASAVLAGMLTIHRVVGTWHKTVDQYFTPTEFARDKFIEAGWPAERIVVKPNFIDPDPQPGGGAGGYALFVGRFSEEKGIDTLLSAWDQLPEKLPLKLIGDGPLAPQIAEHCRTRPHLQMLGQIPHEEVLAAMGEARCVIAPSIWYETFGRMVIEAYAKGTPVVVSRLGALAELVKEGETGLLFEPGNAAELAAAAQRLWSDDELYARLRRNARQIYLEKYNADVNHQMLMEIYDAAIRRRSARGQHRAEETPSAAAVRARAEAVVPAQPCERLLG